MNGLREIRLRRAGVLDSSAPLFRGESRGVSSLGPAREAPWRLEDGGDGDALEQGQNLPMSLDKL